MSALASDVAVLVVGAGAMGSGIAQVAARAGHPVFLYDQDGAAIDRGKRAIEKDLRAQVARGRLDESECAATLGRIRGIAHLVDAASAGLAIEAVVEDLGVKRALFAQLEVILAADAILTSNTSSISITALAAGLKRPARVAGLHFFNPAPRMALVEVVSGLATEPAVAATLFDTATAWGKAAVHAASTPGFIVNRVARPYYGEALRVLAERAAEPATLDALMRDACGFPMGPFELMDLIGLDVNLAVSQSVFDACFQDKRYTPSQIQRELVNAGRLGRKSGIGFYAYGEGTERPGAAIEAAEAATAPVSLRGASSACEALAARFAAAGVEVMRGEGEGLLKIGNAILALSDGRTATRRAQDEGCPDVVLFDLARDFTSTARIALARADQCGEEAWRAVVGTLQAGGLAVSRLDDVAGLIGLRTVAMLANEAADAVMSGIGSAADVDLAMCKGTNYPLGPLAWADALGADFVTRVLGHLQSHYGEERYRTSPLLQRKALAGGRFHG